MVSQKEDRGEMPHGLNIFSITFGIIILTAGSIGFLILMGIPIFS